MRADAVCLTHYHGDHIFGLPGLLQTLGAQGRTRPLLLVGPKGLAGIWSAVRALTGPLPYAVRLQEADGPLALDALSEGWPAGAVPVQQWKLLQQGQSVLVKGRTVAPEEVLGAPRRGLSMVFSGDTAPCAALEQAAQGADLLICDATYALPEQEAQAAQWGHSTFGQSAALAARAGAHRLWLTHYSPMITDPEADLPQAQSIFPAAVCGADGMQITLQYEEA